MVDKQESNKAKKRKIDESNSSPDSPEEEGVQREFKYRTVEGNRVIDVPQRSQDELSHLATLDSHTSNDSNMKIKNLLDMMNPPDTISSFLEQKATEARQLAQTDRKLKL